MSSFQISVCILLLSVFISSVSQIILKKAANKTYDSPLKEYLNPMVIGAYGLFFCSVILTMLALRNLPLSMSPILESTGYIFVSVMGYFFLKERFSKRKLMGFALILAGIFIFNL
ncbi:EamA family transporter [Blautia sp.]|uniref:EamA family transporter n=1 Tax=Blautia sp. TaxID=1955243 RepID=UPI00280BBBF1|nr:EamA family transporter [Blautia sp.]MDY3015761.1 EamA family transporter [Blautia sp.]